MLNLHLYVCLNFYCFENLNDFDLNIGIIAKNFCFEMITCFTFVDLFYKLQVFIRLDYIDACK